MWNALAGSCLMLSWSMRHVGAGQSVSSIGYGSDSKADGGMVGVNQHALLRINVHVQVNGMGNAELPVESIGQKRVGDTRWTVSVDEIALDASTPSTTLSTNSSSPDPNGSAMGSKDFSSKTDFDNLVEIEQGLFLDWSIDSQGTGMLQGSCDVSFLLPLLEDNGKHLQTSSTRTLLVALWEQQPQKRKRLLVRRLAHVPRTTVSYERQQKHLSVQRDTSSSSNQKLKPYTVVDLVATSKCCQSASSRQKATLPDFTDFPNIELTFWWAFLLMTATLSSFFAFAGFIFLRSMRNTRGELELQQQMHLSRSTAYQREEEIYTRDDQAAVNAVDTRDDQESENERGDGSNEDQRGEDGDEDQRGEDGDEGDECFSNCSSTQPIESQVIEENEEQRRSQYSQEGVAPGNLDFELNWLGGDDDDRENSGSHVVENTQLLHAWSRQRNLRNSSSSSDDELALPPPMERHVVRPAPLQGITFEGEIERFNALNLSSPLSSRAPTRSPGSSSGRRLAQQTTLHLPSICGSPQPLAWDRPMLFNSPVPTRRRSSVVQTSTEHPPPMFATEVTQRHPDFASRERFLLHNPSNLGWRIESTKTTEITVPSISNAASKRCQDNSLHNHDPKVTAVDSHGRSQSRKGGSAETREACSHPADISPATTNIDIQIRNSPNKSSPDVYSPEFGCTLFGENAKAVSDEKVLTTLTEKPEGCNSPGLQDISPNVPGIGAGTKDVSVSEEQQSTSLEPKSESNGETVSTLDNASDSVAKQESSTKSVQKRLPLGAGGKQQTREVILGVGDDNTERLESGSVAEQESSTMFAQKQIPLEGKGKQQTREANLEIVEDKTERLESGTVAEQESSTKCAQRQIPLGGTEKQQTTEANLEVVEDKIERLESGAVAEQDLSTKSAERQIPLGGNGKQQTMEVILDVCQDKFEKLESGSVAEQKSLTKSVQKQRPLGKQKKLEGTLGTRQDKTGILECGSFAERGSSKKSVRKVRSEGTLDIDHDKAERLEIEENATIIVHAEKGRPDTCAQHDLTGPKHGSCAKELCTLEEATLTKLHHKGEVQFEVEAGDSTRLDMAAGDSSTCMPTKNEVVSRQAQSYVEVLESKTKAADGAKCSRTQPEHGCRHSFIKIHGHRTDETFSQSEKEFQVDRKQHLKAGQGESQSDVCQRLPESYESGEFQPTRRHVDIDSSKAELFTKIDPCIALERLDSHASLEIGMGEDRKSLWNDNEGERTPTGNAKRAKSEQDQVNTVLKPQILQYDTSRTKAARRGQKRQLPSLEFGEEFSTSSTCNKSRQVASSIRSPRKRMCTSKPSLIDHDCDLLRDLRKQEPASESDSANTSKSTLSFTYVSTLSPDSITTGGGSSQLRSFCSRNDVPGDPATRVRDLCEGSNDNAIQTPLQDSSGTNECPSRKTICNPEQSPIDANEDKNSDLHIDMVPDIVPSVSLVTATQNLTAPVWHFTDEQANVKIRKGKRKHTPKSEMVDKGTPESVAKRGTAKRAGNVTPSNNGAVGRVDLKPRFRNKKPRKDYLKLQLSANLRMQQNLMKETAKTDA
ncbi:hypothetical protein ACA910_013247 [Epithemia clementina (nom. ined.)]